MTGDGTLWRREPGLVTTPARPRTTAPFDLVSFDRHAVSGSVSGTTAVVTEPLTGRSLELEELISALEQLPAQQPVTLRVVAVADDPNAGSRELAAAASADVPLAARLLRMANSAFYGLSGRVGDLPFAVTVIGFATVRALAAAAAAGAMSSSGVPTGFWERAATTSTAAGAVSRLLGAPTSQAVCAALLLELGQALLFRCDPEGYPPMWEEMNRHGVRLIEHERAAYGMSHDTAAGRVLGAWKLPVELVSAVESHHDAGSATQSPLHRTMWVSRQLAYEALNDETDPEGLPYDLLSGGAIDKELAAALVRRIRTESQGLAATLAM